MMHLINISIYNTKYPHDHSVEIHIIAIVTPDTASIISKHNLLSRIGSLYRNIGRLQQGKSSVSTVLEDRSMQASRRQLYWWRPIRFLEPWEAAEHEISSI